MLKHNGTIILETERLILRQFSVDDAEDMFSNWANDEEVTKYMTWLPHQDIKVTKGLLNSWVNGYNSLENYNWAIVPKNYGKVVGSISVVEISNTMERCEVGYCLSKSYWNQGIMTESLTAIIKYLFNEIGFNRIQATHNIANVASGKVMLKSGMIYEGKLSKYNKSNKGIFIDCSIYSIIKEDFIG